MDLALMAMKKLKKEGKLADQEESDEINACSIVVPLEVDGKTEEWLVNFKNETHNHPTEIEPFGGAATCLGGAIRDPLSGRTYVYQAMRITGAADPTVSVKDTLEGKLPQKKIVRSAACLLYTSGSRKAPPGAVPGISMGNKPDLPRIHHEIHRQFSGCKTGLAGYSVHW